MIVLTHPYLPTKFWEQTNSYVPEDRWKRTEMDSDYLLEYLKLAALRNCQQSYSSISVTRWLNLPGNRHFGRTIWQNGSSLPTTLRPSHLSNFEHLIESYHGSAPHIQTSESKLLLHGSKICVIKVEPEPSLTRVWE